MGIKINLILLTVCLFCISLTSASSFGYNEIESSIKVINNVSGSLTTLLELTDTPASYTGEAGNCLIVNVGETELEFGSCGSGVGGGNTTEEIWYVANNETWVSYSGLPTCSVGTHLFYNSTHLNCTTDAAAGADTDTWNTTSEIWYIINNNTFLTAETNWQGNFTNMQNDCPAGNYSYGFFANGTLKCRSDSSSGGEGGNTTEEMQIAINNSIGVYNITVNVSEHWNNLSSYNATQFHTEGGLLQVLESFLKDFADAFYLQIGTKLGNTSTEIQAVETDPNWASNYSAHNETWSSSGTDTNLSGETNINNTIFGNYPTLGVNNTWFNESVEGLLISTYYNATQVNAEVGTIDGGDLTSVGHTDGSYDGITFNFTEEAGSPGLDMRMNFTGVIDFNKGIIRYKTSNLAGDYPVIQLWNYDDGEWEDYPLLGESDTFATIEQSVFDSPEHLSGEIVQMRLYKSSNGNTGNHYYVDWLAIADGLGTPAGEEIDPYSYHTNENINASGYNVTADWFKGKVNYSDIQNHPATAGDTDTFNTTQEMIDAINNTGGVFNITANVSTHWNNLTQYNATQFNSEGGVLNLLESWIKSLTDTLYLAIGTKVGNTTAEIQALDTDTFNTTSEMWFVINNGTFTDTDTQDLSYDSGTDVISLTDGGSIDISEVDTTIPALTEDQVEAYVLDNDNTDNLNMSGYNVTGVDCFIFESGGSWCSA